MIWDGQLFADAAVTNAQDCITNDFKKIAGLAVRNNPKRAQLIVSKVLGKHIPTSPRDAYQIYQILGSNAYHNLPPNSEDNTIVIGFAETATLLGFAIADMMRMPYIHSTRHEAGVLEEWLAFEEAHSHATSHRVIPEDPAMMEDKVNFVLVDDELSTGNTAMNTIDSIIAKNPNAQQFLIVTIIDLRSDDHIAKMQAWANERGVKVSVISFLSTKVDVDQNSSEIDAIRRQAVALEELAPAHVEPLVAGMIPSPRYGITPLQQSSISFAAREIRKIAFRSKNVLVLGTEEFMIASYEAASHIEHVIPNVKFSSTTRSPAHVINDEGYALKNGIVFRATDGTERYAYNVLDYDEVVIVTNEVNDSLTGQFVNRGIRTHVILMPELPPVNGGEKFGSYKMEDVKWLLKDLSDAQLEAPLEEREEAIQNAKGHYAESLPIEYIPSDEYQSLFHHTLQSEAQNMANLVATVGTQILAEHEDKHPEEIVLVSLARAGTPVGILVKRWLELNGHNVHHYAISIVRGKGIDKNALTYIQHKHYDSTLFMMDGWTGKGAITLELHAAMQEYAYTSPEPVVYRLCVLADPGECADIYGTRKDVVIPSSFLNSTVSGLISRTVLNDDYIGEHDYHGAKFYKDFVPSDVSNEFLDTVTQVFETAVVNPYAEDLNLKATYRGLRRVEEIAEEFGIPTTTLVKPGVGETTRVLLRRKPWKVLINPDYPERMLEHIKVLAADRDVPLVEYTDMPYSCIGIINPESKSATGNDGKALKNNA